jgi:hypothetical protein
MSSNHHRLARTSIRCRRFDPAMTHDQPGRPQVADTVPISDRSVVGIPPGFDPIRAQRCCRTHMRRPGCSLGLSILLSAVVALLPTAALAGRFSAPVRLPGPSEPEPEYVTKWRFAINDRGQAVGVSAPVSGVVARTVAQSGRIGPPTPLTVPGERDSLEQSIALDARGRVVVGLLYDDGTHQGSPEPHSASCCSRVAIASWQLGTPPPVPQILSPQQSASMGFAHHALEPPSIVIGPSVITALWAIGDEEHSKTQLEEAFGRFGEPLHTAELAREVFSELSLTAHLGPFASWVGGNGEEAKLYTATGSPTGLLKPRTHSQMLPGHRGALGPGFASDDEGDTMFSYMPGSGENHRNKVVMLSSTAGGQFSHRRVIASVPAETGLSLVGGGRRSLLLVWDEAGPDRLFAQRGSVFGPFGRPEYIGKEEYASEAFLDSRGRAVIIYERRAPHHHDVRELLAVIAQPGRRFGLPHRIAPPLRGCQLEPEGQPITTSPNGHAIILLECEDGRQYIIRYTP